MRRTSESGRTALRGLAGAVILVALWLSVVPASAEALGCLFVEARTLRAGSGKYDHSLTFVNGCDRRVHLTAR